MVVVIRFPYHEGALDPWYAVNEDCGPVVLLVCEQHLEDFPWIKSTAAGALLIGYLFDEMWVECNCVG